MQLMVWLLILPMIYLCLVTPIAAFRLLHRPRFPKACLAAIGPSFCLPLYEAYLLLKPSGTILDLIEIWFWLVVSIPIQLVLLTLAFIPSKEQVNDSMEP